MRYFSVKKLLWAAIATGTIAYVGMCLYLFDRQRYFVFDASKHIEFLPSHSGFKLPYKDIRIPVGWFGDRIHGWWIPSPTSQENLSALPNEPVRVVSAPKTILYFVGRGGNKSYYTYLTRSKALRQLGFSVFAIDYRGYGLSKGAYPSEAQVYEDSEAAWHYLTQVRGIPSKQIFIYGESLGGAVAIDLAVKHPEAGGVIVQSSFTSMAEAVKIRNWLWLFPVDLLLTQKFDSLSKVRSLQIPVLFIHGTTDDVIPVTMSQQLYAAAPEPKQLLLIPGAGHYRIYQPGANSYLRAIEKFVKDTESVRMAERSDIVETVLPN